MKPIEFGSRIADFAFGKKVEGKVAAVIPSRIPTSDRYVVDTGQEHLDVHVIRIENHDPVFLRSHTFHPPLDRGQEISRRAFHIRPWVDGQAI